MPLDLNSTSMLNNSTDLLNTSSNATSISGSVTDTSSLTNSGADTTFEVVLIIFLLPVLAVILNFLIEYYKLYEKEKKK